ncbi:ABC transporter substrate-binding protein [Aquibacillus rhizosphaerae]|uniref:ABC transporter substrate-binding protein n=1 Tax=Aquibacillus rhizosphaerae TaxID=3051431 RepID=A0ABT7L926_9BACI|nr:ABC transporter substrate-binding protein [Aquibacillus sp. LR5S19]MDL4842369.1 ABC transporter substrate-binding protein [Aquibacillus sp. LR5S19]
MKMKKIIMFMLALLIILAGCGQDSDVTQGETTTNENEEQAGTKEAEETSEEESTDDSATERTIDYLGESYTVPANVERIVITGAMEAMEDAVVLEVEPVGAVTVAGEFPEIYQSAMGNAESIGEKQQPNFEKILELEPDVILGTTKFPEEVVKNLEKIATTILVSHVSSNWEDNLHLMAQLGGKDDTAEDLLAEFNENIEIAKDTILEDLEGKKVVALRIRGGQVFMYAPELFFNPLLYDQLGLEVADLISKAEVQEAISVEQLADMNPDYIFMQIQDSGTDESSKAFEDLKNNPIVQNITAFQEDQVYENVVNPLLEGGPLYSRMLFLEQVQAKLSK